MNELLDKGKDSEASLDDLGEVDYSAWENKLKDIDMSKVIRVKKPGLSFDLDKKFWEYGLYSNEFCGQLIGWIKAMMVKYACPELKYSEDLPYQVLQQIPCRVEDLPIRHQTEISILLMRVILLLIKKKLPLECCNVSSKLVLTERHVLWISWKKLVL